MKARTSSAKQQDLPVHDIDITPSPRLSNDARRQTQIDTALYIADLTNEMIAMAGKEKMDVLAYFLSMARVEAEFIARNHQV
jgi:hypothetical protein